MYVGVPAITGLALRQGAQPKIHQQNAAALFAHYILGLDVAVQQARPVHRAQGLGYIEANQGSFAIAKWALG